jgi:hypothetical protein
MVVFLQIKLIGCSSLIGGKKRQEATRSVKNRQEATRSNKKRQENKIVTVY